MRMTELPNNDYEKLAYNQGFTAVCGVDEVGRGCLAGPVMAAAVVLPKDAVIRGLNDSKKLSPTKREKLFCAVNDLAVSIGIGIVSERIIDEINILNATYRAMQEAISGLSPTADYALVDFVRIPNIEIAQTGIVKGDATSVSIAAASIIAKVTRDRLMTEYDAVYPQYGFAKNKGYGTKEHIAAINEYGLCPIHRRSFRVRA